MDEKTVARYYAAWNSLDTDAPARLSELILGRVRGIECRPIDGDPSAHGSVQPEDEAQQRGLSGVHGAEHDVAPSWWNGERHVPQQRRAAGAGDVVDFQRHRSERVRREAGSVASHVRPGMKYTSAFTAVSAPRTPRRQ